MQSMHTEAPFFYVPACTSTPFASIMQEIISFRTQSFTIYLLHRSTGWAIAGTSCTFSAFVIAAARQALRDLEMPAP